MDFACVGCLEKAEPFHCVGVVLEKQNEQLCATASVCFRCGERNTAVPLSALFLGDEDDE